jgi:Integrase
MALHILSPREVQTAGNGDHADGEGLILRVRDGRATWVFRYTGPSGRRRDAGFGIVPRDTLKSCGESLILSRQKAKAAREALAAGRDPLDDKRDRKKADTERRAAEKAERKAEAATLARYARDFHARAIEPTMNPKYAAVWIQSLELHVPPAIWHKPIAEVGAVELFEALAKLRTTLPETADRVRRRLAAVFDDGIFFGKCTGNPAAAIRRKLAAIGSKQEGHYTALPYADVPAFVAKLREQKGIAALALEFGLLTAARTGEILGATWDEIDESGAIWRIPAARMKGGEDHTVHLNARALEIVKEAREFGIAYLFPSPADPERPLSNMALLTLVKRMGYAKQTTPHGLCRATFSTWANETGAARPDVIEACLAHKESDRVRRAYNRASFAAERAALLRTWAAYCAGTVQKQTQELLERIAA